MVLKKQDLATLEKTTPDTAASTVCGYCDTAVEQVGPAIAASNACAAHGLLFLGGSDVKEARDPC